MAIRTRNLPLIRRPIYFRGLRRRLAKVKDLENERSSLLTVVRILQTEAYSASQEWKTVEPRRQNQTDKPHTGHAITVKEGKYQTTNRFEILSDTSDSKVNEIVDHHECNNEGRRKTAKNQYGKSSNVSTNNKHKQLNQKQNESQTKGNTSQSATVIIIGPSGGSSVSPNKLPQLILGYIYILKYLQSNFIG